MSPKTPVDPAFDPFEIHVQQWQGQVAPFFAWLLKTDVTNDPWGIEYPSLTTRRLFRSRYPTHEVAAAIEREMRMGAATGKTADVLDDLAAWIEGPSKYTGVRYLLVALIRRRYDQYCQLFSTATPGLVQLREI